MESEHITNMDYTIPEEVKDVTLPNNKVLIHILDDNSKTKGGLLLDPRHYEKLKRGIVVLTGPGKLSKDKTKRFPMLLKRGDLVLVDPEHGKNITVNCKEFTIFDENDGPMLVLGELKPEGKVEVYADTKI